MTVRGTTLLLIASILALAPATAQQPSEVAPVQYTEARSIDLRGEVRLPGTVESRQTAIVAGEVAGKVLFVDVQDGERAEKGEILVRIRPDWYELQHREALGRLKESRARLEMAKNSLDRARELFDAQVISQNELDDAVSEYTAWQGRESQNQAQIDQLQLNLDLLQVRAPFDGVVTRKLTEVGQWIVNGGAVAEMVALDRLEIRIDVAERYYDALRIGAKTRVTFEALPGLELTGTVERIIPRAGDRARTFPVKVSVPNGDGRIGVGMLASVAMPVGAVSAATIVPKDAIVRTGPGEAVYRIADDGTAEMIPVESGAASGVWIEVRGRIRPGNKVITRGNERLSPGQAVEGRPQDYPDP
ncbi:MAG: efflux RND transporter periplasmic adaptor subunit [Acidobacteria bacterium]|nr:efflux RND transporter periplasmic adaptor subunit [Acidobacteriota bacterium]NIM62693.1 efflux RND transporter periplasmic adaptor subunit [Acidobacteriota bacterium]NIO60764.1 efflux RND transporter periplasmic adaptor subunit [Acidobacteriota bacterium]NIQ31835.1 efflux RND transporter periplasmic adaptor subunit [Acidobacteriota bacterium]NIQ87162.1 efflux RND transporter periplasmic adaptor subunit [Acidobacteriota bacterium]